MKTPDLPEIFGNYALGDFAEIVVPGDVSWLPQTAGWFWLAAGIMLLILRGLYKWIRQWYRDRYRREAEKRLHRINESSSPEKFLRDINCLLKLTAMAAFGRQAVARLSGPDWVSFLNAQCIEPPFSTEETELLAHGAYCGRLPSDAARNQLFQACRQWVSSHETQTHV